MIFGKIEYVNLLPFHIYIKKANFNSSFKQSINYKKSYPSKINRDFNSKRVNAAFISSIESSKKSCCKIGIVAKKDVMSVLVLSDKESKNDFESSTSNMLAKILRVNGEVIIGDKALKKFYSQGSDNFVDLAKFWNQNYNLPFVFGIFCFNSNKYIFQKIAKNFYKKSNSIKIPYYILNNYSKKLNLTNREILYYLTKITYKIDTKERKSLKLFLKLSKKV
jgi:chorismate dehydratase